MSLPTVLFVCVHNAGRSQMAAAYTRALSAGTVRAFSAGSEPATEVNPTAVAVMAEIGIDISQATPEKLSEPVLAEADIVITMGCGDACPVLPGRRYEDWNLEDPAGRDEAFVREVRDAIHARVVDLLARLQSPGDSESAAGVCAE